MAYIPPSSLSDHDLLLETVRAASVERQATSALLALLAEVDTRRLYLGEGYSSLFGYCTQRLALSEPAAYSRITAARIARRFPVTLPMLDAGTITLTTISLLAAHLSDENHASLLAAAQRKSKRDLERIVAALHAQPDIPASVRALPVARADRGGDPLMGDRTASAPSLPLVSAATPPTSTPPTPTPPTSTPPTWVTATVASRPPAIVAPLAPRRYLIRMTVSEETQQKLQRARDLLRHVIPDGDVATIVDRALTLLVQDAQRTKLASTARPRGKSVQSRPPSRQTSRRVPASVRRAVWTRDEGRCRFVGSDGRCAETGGLEFHHVVPFAMGGPTIVENLELRCRAHNAFESTRVFGEWRGRPGGMSTQGKLSLPVGSS